MGCDIHIVLERRFEKDGPWVGVRDYKGFNASMLHEEIKSPFSWAGWNLKERHYAFFNDLAGVRGDGSEFGYKPRGLPEDASQLTSYVLSDNDSDLHTHSWLTMEELRPVVLKHKEGIADPAAVAMTAKLRDEAIVDVLQKYVDDDIGESDGEHDEWRLVFAFDN